MSIQRKHEVNDGVGRIVSLMRLRNSPVFGTRLLGTNKTTKLAIDHLENAERSLSIIFRSVFNADSLRF